MPSTLVQVFDTAAPVVLCGAIGAALGGWIQRQIRRRRLRKLGFTSDDLRSQHRFFEKLGEITVAKIPQKVSFNQVISHSWSQPPKYEQTKTAFESLGFQRSGMFVASPQKWVVEFWLTLEPGIFAKIIDSTGRGVYAEVTLLNGGDPALCFENTEDCGLKHREPDRWVHCGQITPGQLVERALSCRHPHEARKLNLAECVSEYEKSVNDYLDWRRSVGISSDEMKRTFDRVKRRRLLKD